MIPVGGITSCPGDVLAIVVAETREQARAAAELVEVTYDVHATEHRRGRSARRPTHRCRCGAPTPTRCRSAPTSAATMSRACSPERRSRCSETFQTQRIEHAFLEPESTLAVPARRRRRPIAPRLLRRPRRVGRPQRHRRRARARPLAVTVELVSNGGAFGGKEDMSNQAHAALAAWLLGRPVKCTLSREESFRMHAKRHPIRLEYTAGCDARRATDRTARARASATPAPTPASG